MAKRKYETIHAPAKPVLQYHTEDELSEMFNKLDALSDTMSGAWQESRAQKEHTDMFGETVHEGQYYFKRTIGPGFHNVLKLSQVSMDRLLHALFAGNQQLQFIAEQFQEKQLDDMRTVLNKFQSPLSVRQKNDKPNNH
jgi:hypothetical protein